MSRAAPVLEAKGWIETQAAFEARKKAFEAQEAERLEREMDKAIKDGTAGFIVKDPAEQERVFEYRQKQRVAKKEREEAVALLNKRREMAKNFADQQELSQAPKPTKVPGFVEWLGSRDRPEVLKVREAMNNAAPYKPQLGMTLFKERREEADALRNERKKMIKDFADQQELSQAPKPTKVPGFVERLGSLNRPEVLKVREAMNNAAPYNPRLGMTFFKERRAERRAERAKLQEARTTLRT